MTLVKEKLGEGSTSERGMLLMMWHRLWPVGASGLGAMASALAATACYGSSAHDVRPRLT